MTRWLVCLVLAALLGTPAHAAPSGQRLASIKQQALALHTVSLSNPGRYGSHALVLLRHRSGTRQPLRLRVWLNGELWSDLAYGPLQSRHLQQGGAQLLGFAPLPAGEHLLRAELEVRDAGEDAGSAYTLSHSQRLSLPQWPRGATIVVDEDRRGRTTIALHSTVSGDDLLLAAEQALELGLPGRALSILQTLSQFEPGATGDARHTLLTGRSLRGWGLDRAAESTFAKLSRADADTELQAEARLQATELALDAPNLAAARSHLDWDAWPGSYRDKMQVLNNRLLLAEGKLDDASRNIPRQAPLLWQYNLAIALMNANATEAGTRLLARIGGERVDDRQSATVRDLANLKLGFWWLHQQQPDAAIDHLRRIEADRPEHPRALLGQGWAALGQLPGATRFQPQAEDLRPAFVQRIDFALAEASGRERERALLQAVEFWTRLRDGDPMDPSVQEVLVAIPYALAQLGADQRAIAYAELAIKRLDALRQGLSRIFTRSIRVRSLDAAALADQAWPPQPGGWRQWVDHSQWWLADQPVAPDNVHLAGLLTDGQVLAILHNMSVLNEAEAMVKAAAAAPNLQRRADQLTQRIQAEREVQQKALDRRMWTWMDQRGTQLTRYLIMARLIMGHVAGRQAAP